MYRRLDDRTESRVVVVHRVGLTATIQVFHTIFLIIDICIYFVIFIFDQPALTSRCLLLGSPSSTSRNLFRTSMTSSTSFRLRRLRYVQKQAHKAWWCDSYLQIWNYESLTHWLTDWPTDRGRCNIWLFCASGIWEGIWHVHRLPPPPQQTHSCNVHRCWWPCPGHPENVGSYG